RGGRGAHHGLILDVVTFAVSFAVAAALYPIAIRFLKQAGSGQVIQAELPESHQKKAGTPTGGGILFVALALVGGLVATIAGHAGALPALAGLALGGVIGFVDDISKLRRGSIGIPARLKLPIQLVLAIPVAWIALDGQSLWWLPLAVVAVAAAGNAVNITDGIDGLAAGLSIIAVGATVLLLPGAPAGEKAVAMPRWSWAPRAAVWRSPTTSHVTASVSSSPTGGRARSWNPPSRAFPPAPSSASAATTTACCRASTPCTPAPAFRGTPSSSTTRAP